MRKGKTAPEKLTLEMLRDFAQKHPRKMFACNNPFK